MYYAANLGKRRHPGFDNPIDSNQVQTKRGLNRASPSPWLERKKTVFKARAKLRGDLGCLSVLKVGWQQTRCKRIVRFHWFIFLQCYQHGVSSLQR